MVNMNEFGILYIVGTPIGNLEDMTLRAIRVLSEVDLIACEDTRVTKKLLDHYEIKTKTISYFQHSNIGKIDYLIEQLREGKNIALVSDAGTPGISDPGQYLISVLRQKEPNIKVIPIPGVSALTSAASICGMIDKEFYFVGFLPRKKGRQTEFRLLSTLGCPIIIYESANRLEKLLGEIKLYFGEEAEVFIARETTKMFEDYWSAPVSTIIEELSSHTLKGEVTLIIKSLKPKNKHE